MILRKVTKYTPAYTEERSQLLIQTIEVSLTQFYSSTNSTGNVAMRRTANNPDFVQEYERGSETCHVTIAHLPLCSTNTILERVVDCHFFLLFPISSSRHWIIRSLSAFAFIPCGKIHVQVCQWSMKRSAFMTHFFKIHLTHHLLSETGPNSFSWFSFFFLCFLVTNYNSPVILILMCYDLSAYIVAALARF